MSQHVAGTKRKRDDAGLNAEGRKRRTTRNSEKAPLDIKQLEQRIAEDPSKNQNDVETLIEMLDLTDLSAKMNLKAGVALCKVFSRLVASGILAKDHQGSKQSQELSDWYSQQYGKYRMALAKLLRSVSAFQRLPLLHLSWRVLEQDAEMLDNTLWVSDSMFKPLLSVVVEIPDGKDIRETYVGEYMNHCHDCCYHSLEHFSYVRPTCKPSQRFANSACQGHTSLEVKMRNRWRTSSTCSPSLVRPLPLLKSSTS